MPITLGCHVCSKRFKARDESAGKRVKCPYCGAAVTVPTPEEMATAGAPTMAIPSTAVSPRPATAPSPASEERPALATSPAHSAPEPAPVASNPTPASVAAPSDWGAESPAPEPPPPPPAAMPEVDPPAAFPVMPPPSVPRKGSRTKSVAADADGKPAKTADQLAAPGWRRTHGGLFWVKVGLFFICLLGFVGFAKAVLPQAGVSIPKSEAGWKIEGYINSNDEGAIQMTKGEQIDVLAYSVPVILGGLCLGFGRLTCGAAPRYSGSKALFAFSGLFTLVALACIVAAGACDKLLLRDTYQQTAIGFLIAGGAAEFWFLAALAASGASLKRPGAARAVFFVGFLGMLAAIAATLGWHAYVRNWRPRTLNDDWKMYEQAALMLGWVALIGAYWRSVGSVRGAIRDFLEGVEE